MLEESDLEDQNQSELFTESLPPRGKVIHNRQGEEGDGKAPLTA